MKNHFLQRFFILSAEDNQGQHPHANKILYPGAVFIGDPKSLFEAIETAFRQSGAPCSKMVKQTKSSLKPEEEIDLFGALFGVAGDSSPMRGRHYCKEPGAWLQKLECGVLILQDRGWLRCLEQGKPSQVLDIFLSRL